MTTITQFQLVDAVKIVPEYMKLRPVIKYSRMSSHMNADEMTHDCPTNIVMSNDAERTCYAFR